MVGEDFRQDRLRLLLLTAHGQGGQEKVECIVPGKLSGGLDVLLAEGAHVRAHRQGRDRLARSLVGFGRLGGFLDFGAPFLDEGGLLYLQGLEAFFHLGARRRFLRHERAEEQPAQDP